MNRYPEGEVLAYRIAADGKSVLHMGSLNLDSSEEYPAGMDLLTLPFQDRSDLKNYALQFIERLKPKALYLHHFDDAFRPVSSPVDTAQFVKKVGREYRLNSPRMTHSQMISAINHVAGEDLGDFYNRHMSGKIAREMPPVENFIDEYEKPFLKWLDTYAATPGYVSGESRTMLLIALEMGIHHPEGH